MVSAMAAPHSTMIADIHAINPMAAPSEP